MRCPNCDSEMDEGDSCPECDHTENGYCECSYCDEQRFPVIEDYYGEH